MALTTDEIAVILTQDDCIALLRYIGPITRKKAGALQECNALDILAVLRKATKDYHPY